MKVKKLKININKMKISKNKVIFTLLLIPYFEPLLFKENIFETVDSIYSLFKIIGMCVICFYFLKYNFLKQKISICSYLILMMELLLLFSTIVNKGDIVKFLGPAVSIISLVLITEVFFRKLKLDFLKISRNVLFILTMINVIFQIIYPTGILPEVNFLGIDNRLVFFYIPMIFFSALYDLLRKNKLSYFTYFLIGVSLWSTISLWAVGGFLGLIIMLISIVLADKIKFLSKISMTKLIIIDLIINLLVVFLQVQKYFENFIVNILHKDITLTGRIYLWEWAIDLFKKYPIMGVGIQSDSYMFNIYRWVAHPHNMLLNYITTLGIIGIILYLLILFRTAWISKYIKNITIRIFSSITVFMILFLSIADTLDCAAFYMIYVVINLLPIIKRR